MPAPPEIEALVERFELHREDYLRGDYNETQVRREFLDPVFKALGWDVDNTQGHAEAYKDVIHEDALRVAGGHKAPDYGFRIGGTRKFFVEAKKPAVNIREDYSPAFQLRRYAWSAKLSLSILTDFDEWAVYDTRVRPTKDDKPSTARVLYLRGRELVDRWDELAAIFSREAILKGSFDKFAESNKKKRGTAEVDSAFLAEIESWRAELAKNLALRNGDLSQRDLNFAVQRIIDRLIFLRITEDRGIEDYGRLLAVTNGPGIYGRLGELFRQADDRYNSGLFHFEREKGRLEPPDDLTLTLKIDDKLLRELIRGLYYPESPYEFAVLSADILGQVYEQFLGKVIRLSGKRAIVEDKPEVKKAGGVFYTPTYIVDYIVRQTVGKLLEGKTPKQAAKLRVLDPACGSGSFLIGAYQFLLDWHRDWYLDDGPEKHAKLLYRDAAGAWRLTTAERKRILLNNIYGVDIDAQAVEVTKLSLLLKVLEGASREAIERQRRFLHERALPDLGANIKCGNSLIGSDFYDGRQMDLFDEEEQFRINVFDWAGKDGFPEIMKSGGFDAVIGNPPYVRQESIKEFKGYLSTHYESFESTADLYVYFIERTLGLLKRGGLHSFIVSSSFLRSAFGQSLREHITSRYEVTRLTDFGGLPVFATAKDTYVCIPLVARGSPPAEIEIVQIAALPVPGINVVEGAAIYSVPKSQFTASSWLIEPVSVRNLFERIESVSQALGKVVRSINLGIKTGLNEAFEVDAAIRRELVRGNKKSSALLRQFLGGQDIRRYTVTGEPRYLIAIPNGWTRTTMLNAGVNSDLSEFAAWRWFKAEYSSIASHLEPFADAARRRQDQGEYWWELRPCDYYDKLDQPKIIYPDIAKFPRFCLDDNKTWIRNTAYFLATSERFLLGLLNSKLMWFCLARISIPFGTRAGEFRYRLFTQYVERLPIRIPQNGDSAGIKLQKRITDLVERMMQLQSERSSISGGHSQTLHERQIDATDRQIDQLVYELYGLTDEEIALVEAT